MQKAKATATRARVRGGGFTRGTRRRPLTSRRSAR